MWHSFIHLGQAVGVVSNSQADAHSSAPSAEPSCRNHVLLGHTETRSAVSAPDCLFLSFPSHQQRLHCGRGAGVTRSGGLLAQVSRFSVGPWLCLPHESLQASFDASELLDSEDCGALSFGLICCVSLMESTSLTQWSS